MEKINKQELQELLKGNIMQSVEDFIPYDNFYLINRQDKEFEDVTKRIEEKEHIKQYDVESSSVKIFADAQNGYIIKFGDEQIIIGE